MRGFVYKLVCPIKKAPIYVESTVKFPNVRLAEHLSWIKRETESPLYKYLKESGSIPEIEVLEKVEFEEESVLRVSEKKWIDELFAGNAPLLNTVSPNGRTPQEISPITTIRKKSQTTMVRIDLEIVEEVRKYVEQTRQSVGGFFSIAAKEKLQKSKSK